MNSISPFSPQRAGWFLLFLFCASPCLAETPPTEPTAAANGVDPGTDQGTYDPLEGMNRAVYKFNTRVDRAILKPVAKGYDFITPNVVQHSISNLLSPSVVLNDLLQAKFRQSAADTGRFLVNSTVGIVGLFDVAKHVGPQAPRRGFRPDPGDLGTG